MAYYALKKDVFDINKVTVDGSPTITSDGVASGFSVNDYLTANVNINSSNFDIDFEFTLPNIASGGQFVFRFNNSSNTRFVVTNAKILMYDNTNLELCSYTYTNNYNEGDLIKAKVNATSSGITLNLLNKTKNTTVTVSSSKVQNIDASLITFGRSATTVTTDIFTGSINLSQFKIYVDGQLVFQPVKPTYLLERRKEGYDPSKFTIVGSPTITSNGVASGFTTNDYVVDTQTINFASSKSWQIYLKIKTPTVKPTGINYMYLGNSISVDYLMVLFNPSGQLVFQMNKNITGTTNNPEKRFLPDLDTEYDIVIGQNDDFSLLFKYKKTIENEYKDALSAYNFIPTKILELNSNIQLGVSAKQQPLTNGSINLPSTSITVDGKEVFTGAKEVYYAMEK